MGIALLVSQGWIPKDRAPDGALLYLPLGVTPPWDATRVVDHLCGVVVEARDELRVSTSPALPSAISLPCSSITSLSA